MRTLGIVAATAAASLLVFVSCGKLEGPAQEPVPPASTNYEQGLGVTHNLDITRPPAGVAQVASTW